MSEGQKRRFARFRYGMGVFKLDFALSGPIPWKAQECARAATVHLGGSLPEIDESELAAQLGRSCAKPFVLVTQPSLFDPSRAPSGQHTAWAYCHVPQGSTADYTEAIENQIERFAPGFRARVLARGILSPARLEQHNSNYIGGDISGGAMDLQQLVFRPYPISPYRTPLPGVFLCSSSTPPGPGVHGMCGYWAAMEAITCTTPR
jgi:phytoene dehydrogenase-like protein